MKKYSRLAYWTLAGGWLLALTQPALAVKTEERAAEISHEPKVEESYLVLKNDSYKSPAIKQFDVLICLHGAGDTATNFAKNWTHLVDSRLNLIVVVPEADTAWKDGFVWDRIPLPLIAAILDDLKAHDRINPKHVMLMGTSQGGVFGFGVLQAAPQLFACYGGIATDCSKQFFTPKLKEFADKIAIYYAVGTQDTLFQDYYAPAVARLKEFGFNILTEQPNCGHVVASEEIDHMMTFFDHALLNKDLGKKPAVAVGVKKQ